MNSANILLNIGGTERDLNGFIAFAIKNSLKKYFHEFAVSSIY